MLLLKVTKVTTGHQKLPKVVQNSIIRSFFARRAKKVSAEGRSPFFLIPSPDTMISIHHSVFVLLCMSRSHHLPPPNYTMGWNGELWSNRPLTILTTQCCIHANSMRPCRFLASMQIPCVHTNSVRPCKFRENLEYKADSVTESMNDKLYLEHPRLRRVC